MDERPIGLKMIAMKGFNSLTLVALKGFNSLTLVTLKGFNIIARGIAPGIMASLKFSPERSKDIL